MGMQHTKFNYFSHPRRFLTKTDLFEGSDQNRGLFRAPGRIFQSLFALVIQHKLDRRRQALEALLACFPLSVGFRHFWTEGDEPFSIPLNNRRVAISHCCTLHGLALFGKAFNIESTTLVSGIESFLFVALETKIQH